MTTVRRQAASCLYGLRPMLADILMRKLDRLELLEASDSDDEPDFDFVNQVRSEIEGLLEQAAQLTSADPKVEAFLKSLLDKSKLPEQQGPGLQHLPAHPGVPRTPHPRRRGCGSASSTDTCLTTSGQTSAAASRCPRKTPTRSTCCCRRRSAARGSTSSSATSSSTTTCRGTRCGSSSASAASTGTGSRARPWRSSTSSRQGTVDADIYERCLSRIGVFQHAVGGSEEILGKITQELHDIADSFTLSPEERRTRLQQLADNSIRLIREEQELEAKQSELFGLNVPNQAWRDEIRAAESFWLSAAGHPGVRGDLPGESVRQ